MFGKLRLALVVIIAAPRGSAAEHTARAAGLVRTTQLAP